MEDESSESKGTVRLDLDELYGQTVILVGKEEADKLWSEHRLDSEENWPGKWATAMELVEGLKGEQPD